jgi:hypothetical protein
MTPGQLLVYGFAPGAEFEGRLVGAIERIESGGTLRVLDVVSSCAMPKRQSSSRSSDAGVARARS